MGRQIRKAAVLGAGVMGAAIAAHLANVGIPVLLLDIVPTSLTAEEQARGLTLGDKAVRNRLSMKGLETAVKAKPTAFYSPRNTALVTPGNLEDDLSKLAECDWIIEAVVENLAIKQKVLSQIEQIASNDAIVSSNTSGISIAAMSAGCSPNFQRRFMGTHFFNPPRYMKLLELIPGPKTDAEIVEYMREFASACLGKGVVLAKDTPNFIANRIGTYGLLVTLRAMTKFGLGVDDVDALTGPVMGRPKSATFRTLDLVGIDTFVHVANNVRDSVEEAWEKEVFTVPPYVEQMVQNRWLGEKSGQGFFKRERSSSGTEILALDLETFSYRPRRKVKSAAFEAARSASTIKAKLQALAYGKDDAAQFVWTVLKKTLLYTASKQDEIADDIVAVDEAMKWGFNWELGPYETWDAIGVVQSVERMRSEGETIPPFVEGLLASGRTSFYDADPEEPTRFYTGSGEMRTVEERPEHISLAKLKARGKLIRKNSGASLIDIGDGVVCLEFHGAKQAIGSDVVQMIEYSIGEITSNWDALIIGNEQRHFCVGANAMLMLLEAQDENWDELNRVVHQFQQALMRLKYLPKPVVAAPFSMTLGGGAEVCLAADSIQAAAETYMGLVETGIGLIPGGGGNKEVLIRAIENVPEDVEGRLDAFVRRTFETIAMAKVSTSAQDAQHLGLLRGTDGVSINQDFQIYHAKQRALSMVRAGYRPPAPRQIPVIGESGAALLKVGVYGMKQGGYISDHDVKIAHHLIRVLTGGALTRGTLVSEQYLLDLEREAFLSLIGEPKTQARMQHLLTTGKPLRN